MLSMRKFRKSTSMRAEIEWNEKLLIDLEWPYSYTVGASGLPDIHEWLSLRRARGRSPSGLP